MRIRLILQPPWLRFLVWALLLAVVWGGLTSFQSRAETESTILSAIVFGAAVAGYFTVSTQGIHRGALAAVSGLDQAGRSQAIDAILHGAVPADPEVRASAIRLGRVCLRNKSADQLKRQERRFTALDLLILHRSRCYRLQAALTWSANAPPAAETERRRLA